MRAGDCAVLHVEKKMKKSVGKRPVYEVFFFGASMMQVFFLMFSAFFSSWQNNSIINS